MNRRFYRRLNRRFETKRRFYRGFTGGLNRRFSETAVEPAVEPPVLPPVNGTAGRTAGFTAGSVYRNSDLPPVGTPDRSPTPCRCTTISAQVEAALVNVSESTAIHPYRCGITSCIGCPRTLEFLDKTMDSREICGDLRENSESEVGPSRF